MHAPALFVAARILVGCMFLYSCAVKATGFSGMVQLMRAYSFPLAPVFLVLAMIWEFVAAGAMVAGLFLLMSGIALAVLVAVATATIHGQDAFRPDRRSMALVHISNNFAIVGGLLAIASL